MIQAGAVLGPIERSTGANRPTPGGPITPVHDLNVPYEGTEEYETPTAEILFPPVSFTTTVIVECVLFLVNCEFTLLDC